MAIHPTAPTHLAAALAERLAGEVIAPDHPEHETARRVWNGMIDKRPAWQAIVEQLLAARSVNCRKSPVRSPP